MAGVICGKCGRRRYRRLLCETCQPPKPTTLERLRKAAEGLELLAEMTPYELGQLKLHAGAAEERLAERIVQAMGMPVALVVTVLAARRQSKRRERR